MACQVGNVHCVELLLRIRADVNSEDFNFKRFTTPLMLACDAGEDQCVVLLLEYGACPYQVLCHKGIELKGEPNVRMISNRTM